MNLQEIRQMVASIIDYDPQVDTYKNEVIRMINESYVNWFCAKPYEFAQKTCDVYTMPDASDVATTIQGPPAGTADTPQGNIENLQNPTVLTSGIAQVSKGLLNHEGSILKLSGAVDSKNNGTYIIDKIDRSNARIYVSRMSNTPRVQWQPAGTSADTVTCNVEQRYVTLPSDCNQILDCSIRNQQEAGTALMLRLQNITRRQDDELELRYDLTGSPDSFVVYDSYPEHTMDVFDFTPKSGKDFTVAVSVQAGPAAGWPQGTYEFAMSYVWRGVESQMSDPQVIDISLANRTFTFNTIDTTSLGFFGLRKKFYVRMKEGFTGLSGTFKEGFFRDMSDYQITNLTTAFGTVGSSTFLIDDSVTSYAWNNNNTTINNYQDMLMLGRTKVNMGYRKRLRLYPRPTTQIPLQLRYCFFPKVLEDEYDIPNCPADTHRLIVYMTCAELFMKHNNPDMAMYYQKKAEKELQRIDNKYLTQRAANYIKGGYRIGGFRPWPHRTLTYLG